VSSALLAGEELSRTEDLVALLGWEQRDDARALSWGPVEERLGFAFPSDHKELMSAFGTGLFAGLVQVICPAGDAWSIFWRTDRGGPGRSSPNWTSTGRRTT
jgi:hypothetical protein